MRVLLCSILLLFISVTVIKGLMLEVFSRIENHAIRSPMKSKLFPKWVINAFFILGLCSAFCFRLLVVFNYVMEDYGRLVWYIGIIGYIFFFGFRFYISTKRRRVINERRLHEIVQKSDIQEERKEDLVYLLNSITKSKEVFNYIFIFCLSGVAIVLDIVLKITLKG